MENNKLQYRMSLKLYFEDKGFGPGIAALLRNIEKKSSLLGAAKEMNMSYSKAWKTVKNIESVWGFKLTDRKTGGKDGGGSTLTPRARKLLENYEKFCEEGREELDKIFEKYFSETWVEDLKNRKDF